MKQLKLLWLLKRLSKIWRIAPTQAGEDILNALWLELGEGMVEVDTEDIDKQEMGFKTNG